MGRKEGEGRRRDGEEEGSTMKSPHCWLRRGEYSTSSSSTSNNLSVWMRG